MILQLFAVIALKTTAKLEVIIELKNTMTYQNTHL